jgi:hypothetical protein
VTDMLGRQGGLTSSLVAYNLKCNPWCENKVLVLLLILIGGFHFSHLL